MEKAKKASFKSCLLGMILCGIVAVVLLAVAAPSLVKLMQGPEKLDYLVYDENQEGGGISGKYVEGTVYYIYDWYCETTKGSSQVSREYIIDADATYYMGMLVPASGMDKAEALYEASCNYSDGTGDENAVYEAQYIVRGTIRPMPSDSQELYYAYLEDCGLTSEEQSYFLPYYLEVGKVGNLSVFTTWGLVLLGVIMLIVTVVIILRLTSGSYQKEISAYITASGNTEMARAQVKSFFDATEGQGAVRCTQEFISAQSGANTMFRKAEELVWVYKKVVTHKRNFITVGHTYYLMLGFLDGKQYSVTMKNEAAVDTEMNRLGAIYPRALVGYSDELDALYANNRAAFLQYRYYGNGEQSAAADPYGAQMSGNTEG